MNLEKSSAFFSSTCSPSFEDIGYQKYWGLSIKILLVSIWVYKRILGSPKRRCLKIYEIGWKRELMVGWNSLYRVDGNEVLLKSVADCFAYLYYVLLSTSNSVGQGN